MSVDPYAPCPCGSGKKVKFCCQAILPEMEKVERLLENNQPRMALQTLEKILPEHSGNPWVATALGWALIADHRPADAKGALARFLRKNPDHPSANALHALAAFQADGFPTSKKAVHRAFRRSFQAEPSIVAGLAASMAEVLLQEGRVLAGRQHYALVLRYGDEQDRKQAFSTMVEIDGDESTAYPLRGVHNIPDFQGNDETRELVQKAQRLSAVGCWEEAAELLRQVVEKQPAAAAAWQTLGLFLAWDGADDAAAEALHRAGQLSEPFEAAVECETLAQLLDGIAEDDRLPSTTISYQIESVSRLLTNLDAQTELHRVPDAVLQMSGFGDLMAAQYDVLDRPIPKGEALQTLTPASAPQILARVMVLNAPPDAAPGESSRAVMSAVDGESLHAAQGRLEAAAGDALHAGIVVPADERMTGLWHSRERLPLRERFFIPLDAAASVRERVELEWQEELVTRRWPGLPQRALGGRSPLDVKGHAEWRVPLAAAINVLDALCDSRSRILPVNDLRRDFDLPPLEPIDLPAEANVNLLSLMQLRRVNLNTLSDEQFRPLLRRVLLSRHHLHAYETLRHYLEQRVHLHDSSSRERDQALDTLVDVCRRTLRRDEAIQWARQGQALASSSDRPFELLLGWKMKELMLRIEDRDDPLLRPLFDEIWRQFGSKLPGLRERLIQLGSVAGLEPPGQGVLMAEAGLSARGAELSLEPAAAAGEKKLWLPGMD